MPAMNDNAVCLQHRVIVHRGQARSYRKKHLNPKQHRDKTFQHWASAPNLSILTAIPARGTPRPAADGYAKPKLWRRNHSN